MAIYCSHCGTKLEDFMAFCYKCGNPPKGASKPITTRTPKIEYKQITLELSQKPFIEYARGVDDEEDAIILAERRILEMLKPLFDKGWQLDGTFSSAVRLSWVEKGFNYSKNRLQSATVRLILYN